MSLDHAKRIGVLMGGRSSEREISLKSGRAVFEALKNSGCNVVSLEVFQETEEEIRRLVGQQAIDIVFIAMHGGFGEDGRLQHILEKIRVPYTGPQEQASRLAMDKAASHQLFKKAGLRVPNCCIGRRPLNPLSLIFLRYPVVVKPSRQGSSIGISFVHFRNQLKEAMDLAFKFDDIVLIEEFIKGREITVAVLDGRALPIVEIVSKKQFFDYQAKYEKGFTEYIVPAALDPKTALRVQRDAVKAYETLGCRHLSRIDMIVAKDGTPYILEVNTIPGFTERSLFPKAAAAAGMNFDQLCAKLVELTGGQKQQQ